MADVARVIVIGAGVGGLATAARLSVKGHEVTVVEQAETIGGKAGRYERDGFVFDTGPSLFTIPAVYRDLFAKTGRTSLDEALDVQLVDPAFRYEFADGSHTTIPGVGVPAAADAMGYSFGLAAGRAWRDLMRRAAEIWRLTYRDVLMAPVSGFADYARLARSPAAIKAVAPWQSLRAAGKSLPDPRQRMILDRYATYTGSDPRLAPAALLTIPYVEQAFGAWHLGGGVSQLPLALLDRCVERGVDVRTGSSAVRVHTDSGAVRAVELATGEILSADVVVANADSLEVVDKLVPDPALSQVRKDRRRSTGSLAGFVMLLALEGRTPNLEHHNVLFPSDYDAEFDQIFGPSSGARRGRRLAAARPVDDPAIYICSPDDPAMRPDAESESWFVLVNAPPHGVESASGSNSRSAGRSGTTVDWTAPELAQAYAERILDRLDARYGVRARLRWFEARTPADLERTTAAPGGSIYGTASHGARSAFRRAPNTTPIDGLFLVGGSAHPGGGLPLVGMGAEIVANLIGRDGQGGAGTSTSS